MVAKCRRNTIQLAGPLPLNFEPERKPEDVVQDVLTRSGSDQNQETD